MENTILNGKSTINGHFHELFVCFPGSQSFSPTLRSVLRLRARRHAVAQRRAAVGPGALLAAGLPQHLAAQTWKRKQW